MERKLGKKKNLSCQSLNGLEKVKKNGEKQLIWQDPIVIAFRASAIWPQLFKSWIALSTG